MGLRFRQSFQLFPGVRLNLSKGGISASFGGPGGTVNVGPKGIRSTIGIPGSGVSYSTFHPYNGNDGQTGHDSQPFPGYQPQPGYMPSFAAQQANQMREINSASVEQLTSASLLEIRDLIAQARQQRKEITQDLKEAQQLLAEQSTELTKRKSSIFRSFFRGKIAQLEETALETEAEVERLTQWRESTHLDIYFETTDIAAKAYANLVRAFDTLSKCKMIWDITSHRSTDQVAERSAASRTLDRKLAKLEFTDSDLVRFSGRAMKFQNINGEDILIYPGVILMPRSDGAFALVDIREVQLTFKGIPFIEEDPLPADTTIIRHTWAKVNKDGSPDRRFNGNYQIPVVAYGSLVFRSPTGIEEEYQFSNEQATVDFASAFQSYQASLSQ